MATAPVSRIFVAEDNPADVYMIEFALRENGVLFDLHVAATGKEALTFLDREDELTGKPLDLVVLDLNLPQHDGTEILLRLRENSRLGGVPVVVFTSSDFAKDRIAALDAGANLFIRKPSNLAAFVAVGATLKGMLSGAAAATH
jgi:CheY-like chemotaxis protein